MNNISNKSLLGAVIVLLLLNSVHSFILQVNDRLIIESLWRQELERVVKSWTEVTPTPESSTSAVPSDWKTYRNEEYGFEFMYPGDLDIEDSDRALPSIIEGKYFGYLFDLNILSNPERLELENWYKINLLGKEYSKNPGTPEYAGNLDSIEKISADGIIGIKIKTPWYGDLKERAFFGADNFVIMFSTAYSGIIYQDNYISEEDLGQEKTFNQILSTFKFTK